jgi:hypothetical protein
MPLFGGSPGGTSSGNTSSYSCKMSKTALGNGAGKLSVDKKISWHMSTKNMELGSLKCFRSPFLAIITNPCFPIVLEFCGYGGLFGFGLSISLALCDSLNSFSLSRFFLLRSSFNISSGVKGSKEMRSPLYMKITLLERPQI